MKKYIYITEALIRSFLYDSQCVSKLTNHTPKKPIIFLGTGGSISDLDFKLLEHYSILVMSRGFLHFYKKYNILPNYWFLHNSDSLNMVLDQNYFDLSKIDFSSVHIVLPSIFSFSKRFRVYSKWHKLIINNFYNINFLTFNENLELLHPSRLQNKYLQSKTFSYPKSPP